MQNIIETQNPEAQALANQVLHSYFGQAGIKAGSTQQNDNIHADDETSLLSSQILQQLTT
ncbi:MAG: hypothetical protein K9J77_06010 [Rhodoferax sp.]|nr:hypothetical protein [Rhodoferax sp.]